MPHSSRKKPSSANHKRLQVTDAAGWTHVTTNENGRRCRTTPKQDDKELALVPAEAPPKLTLADLQRQLDRCGRKWTDSTTGRTAIAALRARPELLAEVENIVCVGLGSLSGLLRGGWVDRRNVSMFQLAALVGVGGLFDQASTSTSTSTCNPPQDPTTTPDPNPSPNPNTQDSPQTNPPNTSTPTTPPPNPTPNPPPRIQKYAQDPVFNPLDTALLHQNAVTVVPHPHGFQQVNTKTLLFCPGAERGHLEELLARKPAIVFGGPLEDVDSVSIKGFLNGDGNGMGDGDRNSNGMGGDGDGDGGDGDGYGHGRGSVKLPVFEELEAAFWGMRVYFRGAMGEHQGED